MSRIDVVDICDLPDLIAPAAPKPALAIALERLIDLALARLDLEQAERAEFDRLLIRWLVGRGALHPHRTGDPN